VQKVRIGEVTIDAVIEREGPWRRPQDFFPAYDEATFKRHLQVMEPEVFDPVSGMMFITYQTFVVRTPRHTILVDTCTGEDKGHPPPFDFPGRERWRKELFALGVGYEKIVTGDMMHHAIQCRELDWSPGVDWDPKEAAASRRRLLSAVADIDTLLLPIHFPSPTVGLVTADGDRFHYRFKRE
jgi:glyoxylase-like metal-dependent hydrolase (beta-lactamase superfamily II)